MKRLLSTTILYIIILVFIGCSKGGGNGGGGTTPPAEQNLLIAISPDPGTAVVSALSGSYPFKLLINSTPPTAGVKIDITGTKESDNSIQYSQTSQTSNNTVTSVDLSLQNLVAGVLYVVKVDVTSLTTFSNKASITFKIARK